MRHRHRPGIWSAACPGRATVPKGQATVLEEDSCRSVTAWPCSRVWPSSWPRVVAEQRVARHRRHRRGAPVSAARGVRVGGCVRRAVGGAQADQGRRRHRRRTARGQVVQPVVQRGRQGRRHADRAATHDVIVTQDDLGLRREHPDLRRPEFDVIVTVGFLIGDATREGRQGQPESIKFIGVDQGVCVDETGAPDPTFACKGDAATLLPNYQGIVFAEAQPGYLAGIVAASLTKSGTIGAVGGTNVPAVVNYSRGYENGAKSVNPDIKILYQETDPDPSKGFNDPSKGKAIAEQFIGQGADVIFQIAGLTGQGVLEAACDADDLRASASTSTRLVASRTSRSASSPAPRRSSKDTVQAVVVSVASDTFKAGTVVYNAASTPPAIGLSPYHDNAAPDHA